MLKNKKNKNLDIIILIILILFLIILNLVLYVNKILKPQQDEIKPTQIQQENLAKNISKKIPANIPQTDTEIITYLQSLNEGDRIAYYCGQFIRYVDEEDYEKAYNLLYDEFKQNYFPTLESFEDYCKNFYPRFFGVIYDDIDRYAENTYVFRLIIVDYKASAENAEKIQRIVIREYGYNDYKVSIQVDENEKVGNDDLSQENSESTNNVIIINDNNN